MILFQKEETVQINNNLILKLLSNHFRNMVFEKVLAGEIYKRHIKELTYSEVKLLYSRLTDVYKRYQLKKYAKELFTYYNEAHFVNNRNIKHIII